MARRAALSPLANPTDRSTPPATPLVRLPTERRALRARRVVPPLFGKDPLEPEIYRQIYTGLELPERATLAVIGVTSAIRGEGRSTIALGLAATLAQDLGVRVTLVEADLEHPCLADALQVGPTPGLSAVLREERELHEVICSLPARFGALSLIPAGKATKNATPLLRRLTTRDPFRGPRGLTGLVILDLPPLVSTSFGAPAAGLADATILVVRAGVTPHQLVSEAIARLAGHPPQGVVLNAFRTAIPRWWPGRRW